MKSETKDDRHKWHHVFQETSFQGKWNPSQWRTGTKLIAFTVPLIVAVTAVAAWVVYTRSAANLDAMLTQRARSLNTQIMADREYYASVIVPRVIELGGSLGADFRRVHGRFPLPATFVREVSELTAVAQEGYTSSLISPWAINPAKGISDPFQREAFAYLKDHPTGQFFRTDTIDGRVVLRALMADRATAQSCVDCHNAHPSSPRHDFKLNDLMGGLEIVIPMDQYLQESRRDTLVAIAGGLVLCLMVIGIVAVGAEKIVARPLTELAFRLRLLGAQESDSSLKLGSVPLGNEVEHLQETFEQMQRVIVAQREKLEDANRRLTQRVQERTEALQTLEQRFQLTVDHATDAIFFLDLNGTVQWANRQAEVLTGRPLQQLAGSSFTAVLSAEGQIVAEARLAAVRRGESVPALITFDIVRAQGDSVLVEVNTASVKQGEQVVGRLLVARDLTERKKAEAEKAALEEQFRGAQRMEAIGRLAGGIAHDFNNLLTIMLGYSELLVTDLRPGDLRRKNAEAIRIATVRASSLVQQLLAFSRRQVMTTQVLNLNAVVTNLEPMLRRLLGEDIELAFRTHKRLGQVSADPSQIEQIIMNLVINARDAMPRGGKLTIETAAADLDEAFCHRHGMGQPGPHVMLAVSDTGGGMDADTAAHIFEPFFTTKELGKGTGLGLSTVYGIVKQSGGSIWVYSELGQGTTFKIYLPQVDEVPTTVEPAVEPPRRAAEKKVVMVVEDEEAVRQLILEVLEGHGYTVLVARDGEEALSLNRQLKGPLHLLMTDVVMPRMGGRELAERLHPARPDMKILYMSGYTDDAVVLHGVLAEHMSFLQKPFTPNTLLLKVREVLVSPSGRKAG